MDELLKVLEQGNFREVAARFSGIAPRTLRDWMRAGLKDPSGHYGEIRRRVLEAEGKAEIKAVKNVQLQSLKDAKHAEWFLERKFPERWGRKAPQTIEVTGKNGNPIQYEEVRSNLIKKLAALSAGNETAEANSKPE